MADVGIVDRIDDRGNYLDSYAVPASLGQTVYRDGELFGTDEDEGTIYRFKVSKAE